MDILTMFKVIMNEQVTKKRHFKFCNTTICQHRGNVLVSTVITKTQQ